MLIELTACFTSPFKTRCSLSIHMLSLNVTFMWTLVLNVSMNSGHWLRSPSNLRASIVDKLRVQCLFEKLFWYYHLLHYLSQQLFLYPRLINQWMSLWLLFRRFHFYFLRPKINMEFGLLFRCLDLKYYSNLGWMMAAYFDL